MLTRDNDVPIRFLRLVLPEEGRGLYCLGRKVGRGLVHTFVETIDELSSAIEEADRDGYTVYHACGVFKDNSSRKQINAAGAKAFWLDLDAGKGKPYPNWRAATDALKEFCVACNLPLPIVVTSGKGLHVYWPLRTTLDPVTWKRYASGLKNLCTKHGLKADPSRTADIASLLRTPGTHNRKDGGNKDVECPPECLDIEPYTIDAFAVFLEHSPEERGKARRGLAKQGRIGLGGHSQADGLAVAEQCEQVRELRDKKGCIPEPLWYAVLGVLANCENGEKLAHEWSRGYDGYTEEETQKKIDQWRAKATGPTTCKHFHEKEPGICECCPHWGKINSPIALGVQQFNSQSSGARARGDSATNPITWQLTAKGGIREKSYPNTKSALSLLDITFRHDLFHNEKIVEGDVIENLGPALSDAICRALRDAIIKQFRFDPGIDNVQQAAERACEINRFNPVLDYLDTLQWDGQPRIDRWLSLLGFLN